MRNYLCVLTAVFALWSPRPASGQANHSEIAKSLNGVWVYSENPTTDWLKENNLNGAFTLDFYSGVPRVLDGGMGGPFQITKIVETAPGRYFLSYFFDRGGFEVTYRLQEAERSERLTINMIKGLQTKEVGDQGYSRIPGVDKPLSGMGSGGFDPDGGSVNDRNVRLRYGPSADAKIIRLLQTGDSVEYLTRNESPLQVDNYYSYWYRVRVRDGAVGWVFGAFIDIARKKS